MRSARTYLLLLAPVLVLVIATGCGGDDSSGDSGPSEADIQVNDQAAVKAKQAADRVVQATPDKHLPGPKRYLSVCQRRGDADAVGDIPPNAIRCHIEAFYKNYRGVPGGYIWSEDWLIPLQDGKLGEATILGDYRIRNFLREDNKKNCTGRHRPRECLPQSVGGILPG